MRVQIEMKTSPLPWAKKEQITKDIDLQPLFDDYWNSKEHILTVLGQSQYLTVCLYLIEYHREY